MSENQTYQQHYFPTERYFAIRMKCTFVDAEVPNTNG